LVKDRLTICKLCDGEQLEPVAPGIRCVKPTDARKRVVPFDALACGFEPVRELVQLLTPEPEPRMRLVCRCEGLFHANVKLAASAEREPHSAPRARRLGLLELLQPQQPAEETARLGLAAGRRGELDVV
jgi:hypothetical protein